MVAAIIASGTQVITTQGATHTQEDLDLVRYPFFEEN